MQTWNKRLTAVAALVGLSTIAVVANGWEAEAKFNTSVHDHTFHKLVMQQKGDSCVVDFKLSFRAPAARYQAPDAILNYYRFKAQVLLSEGKTLYSRPFANDAPGNRVFRWSVDTTGDGCWAQKPHKIYNLDVEGCRNRNCRIRPFR